MISLNAGAVTATGAFYLGQNNKNLQKSLVRLSSGLRINSSADDPAGLSVSMKLMLAIRRNEAASTNVSTAASYLQTQDGALQVADSILLRMAELASRASSSTIASTDRALYDAEVDSLKDSLGTLFSDTFNGISLFHNSNAATPGTGSTLAVVTGLENQTTSVSAADLGSVTYHVGSISSLGINLNTVSAATSAAASIGSAINNLAALRATNGAQQNRLVFAMDLLEVNKLNLEAANSRIMELDFATEIANYTRYTILEQSNIVLLSQANLRAENALRLLEID
jgi:flagellin